MKNRLRYISILCILLLTTTLIGCGGGGTQNNSGDQTKKEVIKLTIGSGHPMGSMPYVRAADEFFVPEVSKRVKENTNYTIEWTTAYGGSIAKLAEVLGATEKGLLDVGLVCTAFEPSKLFIHNLNYYIPFNTPDAKQAIRITRQLYDEFDVFTKAFEDNNQKFLGLGGVGNYQLLTTYPVDEFQDVKNKKICAAGPNLGLLKGTGAVPIQGDLTEAYSSFQSGLYEGWIMYSASTYGFKLHEVAPYQTNINFGADAIACITINNDVWEKLPAEVQDIMLEVGTEYQDYCGDLANKADSDGLAAMQKEGLKVTDFPFEEKEKWAAVLPNIPAEFAKEADAKGYPGTDIVKRYIELLEGEGYVFPRDWF